MRRTRAYPRIWACGVKLHKEWAWTKPPVYIYKVENNLGQIVFQDTLFRHALAKARELVVNGGN